MKLTRIALIGLTSFTMAIRLSAVESWADAKLSVTNGLQVWLDASRQLDARKQENLRPLPDGSKVDCWLDGSGHRRDVTQMNREATPQLRSGAGVSWMVFDGQNDYLAASRLGLSFSNATLFIVAAPKSNAGFFRGLFACTQTSQNDYVRGLNVDLGPNGSPRFDYLNIEMAGAGGARNFLRTGVSFGGFHVLALQAGTGANGIKTWFDGQLQGSRDRSGALIRADEVVVGGRLYSNSADLPFAQGFLNGNIAEVLLYSRVLTDAEREQVSTYLAEKYAALRSSAGMAGGFDPLMPVEQPPAVQMFVPGFAVRELPVKLPNINVLKYRPDGKLMALGYNGQIYLLSDSDGDGLEDKVSTFWGTNSLRSPIGMALTPPGYARGQGAFIPTKGRLALIVDTDGDDKADQDITVAEGWRELVHSVDSMGVAVDKEGNVYFGLGVENFTNPYLVDQATGKSRFDLNTERGTILKVSPDFKKREVIATGIRFSVALAFNEHGDLFCTDQEGATWLSNGNPFDELLHIQTGRHYGFPPRHPKYLPNVIDEPSTFDYAPQHQSTCGLNFNNAGNGRSFGPRWWANDALVTGYSRGKLYRTKLIKTPHGYIGDNQLIASLNMLTVDSVVTPRGELAVAVHSGQPDWGSGPNGEGKLYQIRYEGQDLPQPVLTWAESPTETCIAWDRPLTAEQARAIAKTSAMVGGKYVAAGDRFELLRPGYQVVQDQFVEPRTRYEVHGTQLSPDGRVLTIRSQPRTHAQQYAIALGAPVPPAAAAGVRPLTQHTNIDLAYSMSGVRVTGRPAGDNQEWTAWLPSLDSLVASTLLKPSTVAEKTESLLQAQGILTFQAQLNLNHMLRPEVQPGSKIDYTWPQEEVFVRFQARHPFSVKLGKIEARSTDKNGRHEAVLQQVVSAGKWAAVELRMEKAQGEPGLALTWHTAEDKRERPFPLHRILLPWATTQDSPALSTPKQEIPELAGANWLNGRRIFFGETADCYKCHQIRGEGFKVGPDLSNLIHRDYASVLKDILEPNAALNPDHIAYEAELKDGEALTAVLQQETDELVVLAAAGTAPVRLPKKQIQSMKASTRSLMPEDLGQALPGQALKDLMAFLLRSPLEPAELTTTVPADAGTSSALAAKAIEPIAPPTNTFRILLVSGPKDHGPDEHDYPLWQKRWAKLLGLAEKVEVSTAADWPSAAEMDRADVMVLYSNNPGWNKTRAAELARFQERGGGLVYIHYAVDGHKDVEALSERIGLAWRGGASKFRHGPLDLKLTQHPITKGFPKLHLHDESYWQLTGNPKGVNLLASGVEDGKEQPLLWTRENGKGRVFVSIPGHYTWTFDDPAFRLILLRGISWAGHQPVERLSELAFIGARTSSKQ